MLVTIVVLFALCWLPLHTFFFVLNFTEKKDHQSLNLTYFICHWIAMSNSFVNPIVYGSLNDSFRADLRALLCRCCGGQRTQRQGAMKIKRRAGTYHVNFAKGSESKSYANTTYLLTTCQNTGDANTATCNLSTNGSESSFTNRSTVRKYLLRD